MYKIRQLLSCVLFCILEIAMLWGNVICSYASETPTEEIELTVENSYYLHENSNVDTIHALTEGALPCIEEAKILVFYVNFKGGETNWPCTAEYVNDMFFSEEGKYNSSIAYSEEDSLRSYYYRSSYGKVDITGTVYEYETQYDTSYYTDVGMALDEVIDYYRETINWDDYDGNNDGYIDGIYLIARNRHSFGGPNFVGVYENEVSNKKICKACFLDSFDFQTMCHETCHMFGPPDMYAGVGVNPSGIQTVSVMEDGYGDLPSPTKFVLGWLDNVRFIDINSVGNYELGSYSNYSDVLIVYPNGDVTNRNWFFIEYVTGEGNNLQGGNGLRIWKTQMNLDDEYNITGTKEFCNGMPNSPYEYLEAIHPDGGYNYYMTEGETISPYTYPSTSYSDTFYLVGTAKWLKDLTFSGIEIRFNDVQDNVAKVTIQISETPDYENEVLLEANICTTDNSSTFLNSNEKYHIATITASIEIKASGEAKMISSDETKSIPLTYELSKNNRSLLLYIDKQYLTAENMTTYSIVLPDVTTYYGKSIQITQMSDMVDLPMVPIPYETSEEIYSTDFSMTFEYDLTCFKVSDEKILTIFLDDVSYKLFWGEFDLNLNSATKYELQSPEQLEISGIYENNESISVWTDNGYYYVYINGFICCYQNKELVCSLDTATLSDSFRFCGVNQNSYFVSSESKELYHLVKQENELILEKVPFINEHADETLSQTMISNLDNSLYGALKEVYCLQEDRYIVNTDDILYFVKEGNIEQYDYSGQQTERNLNRRTVEVVEDKIYVFDCGNELLRYEFDLDFNLIEKKVLLYKLGEASWGPFTMNVEFIDDIWLVAMESVSNSNAISYSSTFVIVFDKNGSVINYYRYGDESYRHVCQVVPINKDIMVCVKAFSFFYITRPNEHFYSVWEPCSDEQHKRTCECGDIQYARHIWNANGGGKCSICGMKNELPVVVDPVEAFVTRMYQQCLSRDPDQNGLDGWVGQLKGGYMNGADIAEQFVFSNEMLTKNLSNEEFVNVLYRAMMGREADDAGRTGWVNELNNGYLTRSEVTKCFVESTEFTNICAEYGITRGDYDASMAPIEHFVTRFYTLCLERDPDQAGLYGWVNNLKHQYMNGAQIADAFIFSEEFVNKNVSDEKYVELLYNTLLGRQSDENGKKGWVGELQNGYMDRRGMMKAFIESIEFGGICEEYGITRGTIE